MLAIEPDHNAMFNNVFITLLPLCKNSMNSAATCDLQANLWYKLYAPEKVKTGVNTANWEANPATGH
jgi:hypothetical protein